MSEKMDKDDTALVMCSPTNMPAHVPSVRHMGGCGHEVWVSIETMANRIEDERFTFKCMPCCLSDPEVLALMVKETSITPAQRKELNRSLGVAEVDQLMAKLNATERDF